MKKNYIVVILLFTLLMTSCGHEHKYIEEVVKPTCTEEGYVKYTCECGNSYKANEVPPFHNKEIIKGKESTCIEPGLTDGAKCSVCGKILVEQQEIPAGHKYGEWEIIKEATREEQGLKECKCTICGEMLSEIIEKYDYTVGLEYEFLEEQKVYAVVGQGAVKDTEIIIPATYNGYPVAELKMGALTESNIQIVILPKTIKKVRPGAFPLINELTKVYYDGTIRDWFDISFEGGGSNPMEYASHIYMRDINNEYYEVFDIVIPNDVTTIGYAQFRGFNMFTLTIPDNITKIEDDAFNQCYNLYEVYNNSELIVEPGTYVKGHILTEALKVENKGDVSYQKNTVKYNYFTTEEGFKFLNHNDIYYLISYEGKEERPILPATIYGNLYYCKYMDETLKHVELSSDFMRIEEEMFKNSILLESIVIPESVKNIGERTFSNCISLKTLIIKGSQELASCLTAFGDCCCLENVYYDGTLEDWCNIVFCGNKFSNPMNYAKRLYMKDKNNEYYEISAMPEIIIDDSVRHFNGYTFFGFNKLKKITFTKNIFNINGHVFLGCESLESVYFDGTLEDWCRIWFSDEYSTPMCYAERIYMKDENNVYYEVIELEIPEDDIAILEYQFYGFDNLTKVKLSNNLKFIEDYAFYGCKSLKEIIIPNSIQRIGKSAFENCPSLTIYCEFQTQPSGWDLNWNKSNNNVVWGYQAD